MHPSDHDGPSGRHLHFSRNGTPVRRWVCQLIAAELALVAAGTSGDAGAVRRGRVRQLLRGPVTQPPPPVLLQRVREPDDRRGSSGPGRVKLLGGERAYNYGRSSGW